MPTFYNEIDPEKCEWLRQLQNRNVIDPGTIDETSIRELNAGRLLEYTQCHFFAGIGIWQYALRLAGVSDLECWTGSCSCQPFSVAGKKKAALDERHLWPAWFRLITECRPRVVFGEQVADGDGIAWLDVVQTDMESAGYRFGACVLPAAGFGAPHGRHRIFFVADTQQNGRGADKPWGKSERRTTANRSGKACVTLGDASKPGLQGHTGNGANGNKPGREPTRPTGPTAETSAIGDMGNAQEINGRVSVRQERREIVESRRAGPANGFWADAEWIWCRDEVYRAVRPTQSSAQSMVDGTSSDILRLCDVSQESIEEAENGFPLIQKAQARTLRLRGYGEGIAPQVAAAFIQAYLEEPS